MRVFEKDLLNVSVFDTRKEMGRVAAANIEKAIARILKKKEVCNVIFAAAPSQNEVLEALAASDSVEWDRVNAFHMDEYIGLPENAPQGFANFLRRNLFDRVPFASVNCLDSTADPKDEIERYTKLLQENPTDIVVMGVGENGHIAFNDPHVALFDDEAMVKVVELDEVCRKQQVHDGCFSRLETVPETALTLTIPTLMAGEEVFCIVPGTTKADAVAHMLTGPVTEDCPASILRRHSMAKLYLDLDSAAKLD